MHIYQMKKILDLAAYRTIERQPTLKLSLEDSKAFNEALLNPPQPNNALKAAALRYKQVRSI